MKKIAIIPVLILALCSSSFANIISTGENLYRSDQISSALTGDFVGHNNGFYLGGSILFDMTNASSDNGVYLATNHVGFSVTSGYDFSVTSRFDIGLGVQYSKLGNISIEVANTDKTHTFNNITAITRLRYNFTPRFSIAGDLGYGRMFGTNSKRWMPLLGVSTAYMLSGNIALTGSYQHYFGVSNENVFTTDKAVPDFDVVSFGVRYYF